MMAVIWGLRVEVIVAFLFERWWLDLRVTYSEFPLAALKEVKKEYLCFRGPYQPTLSTSPPAPSNLL